MDILTQKQIAELDTKIGKIEVQTPSLKKKLEIEKRRTFYVGGLTVISQDGAELADIFATLDVIMTKSPLTRDEKGGSWNYDEIYDEEALKDAFKQAVDWLDSFRNAVAEE